MAENSTEVFEYNTSQNYEKLRIRVVKVRVALVSLVHFITPITIAASL